VNVCGELLRGLTQERIGEGWRHVRRIDKRRTASELLSGGGCGRLSSGNCLTGVGPRFYSTLSSDSGAPRMAFPWASLTYARTSGSCTRERSRIPASLLDGSANVMASFLSRILLLLISRLSPTVMLRAEAMLFRSAAVARTMRLCILRPLGPRPLKDQTSGLRLRLSVVMLPSCACPYSCC